METPYQIFGSASSEDLDVVFFVAELGSIAENSSAAKIYATQLAAEINTSKAINPNLAIVMQGKLNAVYKGTVDELNNALYDTYALHTQAYPLQIMHLLPRDVELKIIRSARSMLSFFTRTTWRAAAKTALSGNITDKVDVLRNIRLADFTDFERKGDKIAFNKACAFQMGQTLALMDGTELYTKEAIAERYPALEPYLFRDSEADSAALQQFWDAFVERVTVEIPGMVRREE